MTEKYKFLIPWAGLGAIYELTFDLNLTLTIGIYSRKMLLIWPWSVLQERDGLYQHLHTLELPNYLALEELASVQQSWIDGRMTNFDYLTYLNKIAGRSFNDLMQYPIFPFILKDYFSDRLNLFDEKSFRYNFYKIYCTRKLKARILGLSSFSIWFWLTILLKMFFIIENYFSGT